MTLDTAIIGIHPAVRMIRRRIRAAAPSDLNVVIAGEPGTERRQAAALIHEKSLRARRLFVQISSAGAAYAGDAASVDRTVDNVLKARGGTLYIDDIQELPTEARSKLVTMLSNAGDVGVNVRLIAGVSAFEMLEKPDFGERLMRILNEYQIYIAPLRTRKSDIPLLVDHYLHRYGTTSESDDPPAVPEEIMHAFVAYDWPGNTAELRKAVQTAIRLSPADRVIPEAVPFAVEANPFRFLEQFDYHEAMRKADEHLIRQALIDSGWNQTKAARRLNMTEGNIRLKMRKYGISRSG